MERDSERGGKDASRAGNLTSLSAEERLVGLLCWDY